MKLTRVLNRQHIDFMFKRHWIIQGKRVPIDTGVEEHLKSLNIKVEDALEFVKDKPVEWPRIEIVGQHDSPRPFNEEHPDFKERPCYTLKSTSVLLEGVPQAQVLTKTVIADNQLPAKIEELADLEVPKVVHDCVKKAILSANVFDCEQEKLPKIKDINRPAYNFPRILGITDRRRNVILTNKLLHVIEKSSNIDTTTVKYVTNDVESRTTFEKEDDLLQFQEISHILVTADKPLKHNTSDANTQLVEIPDLYPVKYNITMTPEHFYDDGSDYPIKKTVIKRHPHTTWLHYNKTEINNLYEEPVTPTQVLARSLTNAFTVAAAYAKQLYGEDVKELAEPIFINSIQTDGQNFHFGVLELKTLDVNGTDGSKNVWYTKNNMQLYGSSKYLDAIPVLEKYNPKVYGYINAMYNV